MPAPRHTPAHHHDEHPQPPQTTADAGGLLDAIEYRFLLAHRGPWPLCVDGAALAPGLPRRPIPLPELSAILMHPACDFATRDAV